MKLELNGDRASGLFPELEGELDKVFPGANIDPTYDPVLNFITYSARNEPADKSPCF